MTALEDFENTLKEVVSAKRVSASKMNKLTEIAMKSLENDTKLVAILYRTHKSLPSSAKGSSLYAFDALARAARSLVNKHGTTGDIKSEKGNSATFLLKMEGVLDGLIQDMASLDNSEAKEKTKKVLDIWVKSNTFPPAVLTRLRDILSDVRKENAVNPPPIDPRTGTEAPVNITTSSASNAQATLLALLGHAAQISGQGQTPSQIPPNTDVQLQQNQLAVLQQLALTAKLATGSPTPPPGQTPPPPDPPTANQVPDLSHPSSKPPETNSRFDTPGDTRFGRNGHPDRARYRHDFRDERPPRGGFRGGHRGRGRWDDHNQDRFKHRDRDPSLRPRRSRSRSPRRHEERRNVRPHSPPRRPSQDGNQVELSAPPADTQGKDEFGRDIRASSASPSRSTSVEDTQAVAPIDSSVDPTAGAAPDYHTVSDQMPVVAASTTAQSTETHIPNSTSQQQQAGLDQFDIGTFDATAASSWEALGNMWQATYGYPPSQEELMHFVMTKTFAAANGGLDGTQGGQWQQGSWDEHGQGYNGGRRGGRSRGGYAGGHSNQSGYGSTTEQSDAIVLNGEVEPATEEMDKGGQGGGRMQRVGDKWMFVKQTS